MYAVSKREECSKAKELRRSFFMGQLHPKAPTSKLMKSDRNNKTLISMIRLTHKQNTDFKTEKFT